MYIQESMMQVAKWGNSLAIRIPAAVVELLELKEGDDIVVSVAGDRKLSIDREKSRAWAIDMLAKLKKPLPPGWKFDRDEANER
jgi:antitoxin MazE